MSPRAEEGLLACLLRLTRLLPGEQRVSLGHEAGDARLGSVRREVRVYEVGNGVVGSDTRLATRAWVQWIRLGFMRCGGWRCGVGVGVGGVPGCGGRLGLVSGLVWGEDLGGDLMTP